MAEKSVTIRIIGDAKSATGAFKDVEVAAGKTETSLGKIGTTAAGFAIGGAISQLPGLLIDGAKGAAEDEAAMARLKTAVENTGKSYDSYSKTIDGAITKGQELGFTDGETADALATLTSLTGDSDEAMRRLSSAQDLARGAGISLEQAAKLLGKTSDENTSALGRLGIQVGENATAQDVLNAVDEKFKGQAGTYADTAAGQMLIAQQNAGELAETFGGMLIPVLTLISGAMLALSGIIQTNVAPAVQGFIDYLAGFQPLIEPVIAFIQDNLTAVFVALAAMLLTVVVPAFVAWAASAATAAAATVVALAPVIAIMAAVGLAAGALYLAWDTNFLGIRDITQQVIDFVRPYFEQAMSAIQTAVETVFPIIATVVTTYIGILRTEIELGLAAARLVFDTVFPAVRAVVETVLPIIAAVISTNIETARVAIETGVNAIRWAFDNVLVPIQGIVENVFTTIAGLVSSLWGPAVAAIGVGVDTVKTMFDGLVYIQGIVSDVFSTIAGLVDSLWNNGAVLQVAAGIGSIKAAFDGAYDAMVSAGRSLIQGLIDGISSLFGTLKDWIDKVTGLLVIDVPGFSPPYPAGYKQGRAWITGLGDGISSGVPDFMRWAQMPGDIIASGIGSGNTNTGPPTGPGNRDTTPGGGGNTGGSFYDHTIGGATGGGGGSVHTPTGPNGPTGPGGPGGPVQPLPPTVIGEPASGYNYPDYYHNESRRGGSATGFAGSGHDMVVTQKDIDARAAAQQRQYVGRLWAQAIASTRRNPIEAEPTYLVALRRLDQTGSIFLAEGKTFTETGKLARLRSVDDLVDGLIAIIKGAHREPSPHRHDLSSPATVLAAGRAIGVWHSTPASRAAGAGLLPGPGSQALDIATNLTANGGTIGGSDRPGASLEDRIIWAMIEGWRRIQNGGRMTTSLTGGTS